MNDMSDAERVTLSEWVRSTYDAAVHAGLLVPPWRPTDHVNAVLHGYHAAGLTPAEAAQAFFATRH